MGYLESLKPTPVKKIKDQIAEDDSKSGSDGRPGYLSIDEGTNKFRLFPAHTPGDPFMEMRMTVWLELEIDGEMKNRTVMNGRVHGGLETDVVELYIETVRKRITSLVEDEDRQGEVLKVISDWKNGLKYQKSWLLYANKIKGTNKTFGLLEIKQTVRDGINKESTFEDEDDPIEVDPFTDPLTGKVLAITYDSKAKKSSDYYKTKVLKEMPLEEEEAEHFVKNVPPLKQLVENVYSLKEFENALEGLRNFDEKNEIGLFDDAAWNETIENLREELEASASTKGAKKEGKKKDESKSPASPGKKSSKRQPEPAPEPELEEEEEPEFEEDEEEEESGDEFDGMSREELKSYIVKNGLKDSIKVLKSDSDDDLRNKIRNASKPAGDEDEDDDLASIKAKLRKGK